MAPQETGNSITMSASRWTSEDEAALVRAACEGDDAAFAGLISRYQRVVFGLAWAALHDWDEADEATQETFVAAYRALQDLKESTHVAAWLTTIATNVVRKHLHQRTLARSRVLRPERWPQIPGADTTGEQAQAASEPEVVRDAFEILSPTDRAVTTLFYLVGLDQHQIATMLDVPVGTVKSRLHRARHQLKRRFLDMTQKTFHEQVPGADYGRTVIHGMRGVIHWRKLLQEDLTGWRSDKPVRREGSRLADVWSRSGDTILGTDVDGAGERLIIGEASWTDYEFSVLITPLTGGNAQLQVRVSEDERGAYLVDLMLGWQAVQVATVDLRPEGHGLQRLSVVNAPLALGREYDVLIAARGASITTYLDGKLVNHVTDWTYRAGPIALGVWQSQTAFRDPRIRLL